MTNDELNKLIERFEDEDDVISIEESHRMSCGLIELLGQLLEIIKMQKETIDFYAKEHNWEYWNNGDHGSFKEWNNFKPEPNYAGKKARATQSAVNEKLKEMGFEI